MDGIYRIFLTLPLSRFIGGIVYIIILLNIANNQIFIIYTIVSLILSQYVKDEENQKQR